MGFIWNDHDLRSVLASHGSAVSQVITTCMPIYFYHVQADYAMKYKAGIAPPRPKGPKRVSEYQMQFKWREGKQSSPLLAAEQVRYSPLISHSILDLNNF